MRRGRTVTAAPSSTCPPFTRAHRAGFEYELTPVGSRSSATVAVEIADGRFTIATDEPHVKVSWRVTALRGETPNSQEDER